MPHTPKNHENYKKKIIGINIVCRITDKQSKAEAKRLSETSDGASTPLPKIIMTDHLKQVLMTENNQSSEHQCQVFISQVESYSLKSRTGRVGKIPRPCVYVTVPHFDSFLTFARSKRLHVSNFIILWPDSCLSLLHGP